MNFKKRVNDSWTDTPHYIHNTSTDTLTALPAVLYPNAATATVGLKGQTVQSSTPSPTSPVMPQGTGERTGNLFSSIWEQGIVNGTTGQNEGSGTLVRTKDYIPIKPNVAYSFSRNISNGYINVRLYRADKSYIGSGSASTIRLISGTSVGNPMGNNTSFCCFEVIDSEAAYIRFNDSSNNPATKWLMVEGEYTQQTMPSYEPYGYKIPISSANTTTPVYLGEVETTRMVKKLVLTGGEIWGRTDGCFRMSLPDSSNTDGRIISTHFEYRGAWNLINTATIGCCVSATYYGSSYKYLMIRCDEIATTTSDFKSYLAAQYVAGTPVTVWYVLATETTGIVNEPLMRIGDYADTVSNVSIPVTAGGDTLSVVTTVQPSEVTVNYKGWHPVQNVHERDNGAWT